MEQTEVQTTGNKVTKPAPYYSFKSPKQKWDAIVIGSGMGGMCTAALLAKSGKKVLVLEQHYVPGGFTHTFKREHWQWDVGVHAVGEVTTHTLVGKVLDQLTDQRLQWASLGPVYEQFFFPEGFRLDFPDHPKLFKQNLKQTFPEETQAIEEYFRHVKTVAQDMRHYYLSRLLPRSVGLVYDRLFKGSRYFQVTTEKMLSKITTNTRLKTILASQWGYYGAAPSASSFAMQALVTRHFSHGGLYPIGGSTTIAKELLSTVAKHGGWTRVRSAVKEINIHNNSAVGVTLTNGESIEANSVISAIGAVETTTRLLPTTYQGSTPWKNAISKLEPSPCHICLHIGFEGDIRKAGASAANQWFWESWDVENGLWDFVGNNNPPPVLYTSYPSLKDPQHDSSSIYHTGEAVTFVPYEAFREFMETRTQKRPEAYENMKEDLRKRTLAQLIKYMPALEPMIKFTELSTPLSTQHYTRSQHGAIYGLKPTPERFTNSWLRPKTPIKNLYLSGSDVGSAGVIGALVGGVLAAVSCSPLATSKYLRSCLK